MTEIEPIRVPVAHASLQFSDPRPAQKADVRAIFERGVEKGWWWVTGTEAAPGVSNDNDALLKRWAPEYGFRYARKGGDSWVAVAEERIDGKKWKVWADEIVPGKAGQYASKSVFGVDFRNADLGPITVSACHYLTKGRWNAKSPEYRINVPVNKALAAAIGEKAKEKGAGESLFFYGGDQNIVDRDADTFDGQPLTSTWDELKKWQNTGHGNIDVIASYDRDGRVKALYSRALNDTKFPLHTDHFLVEAGFLVMPLPEKVPGPVEHSCPSCGNVHSGVLLTA